MTPPPSPFEPLTQAMLRRQFPDGFTLYRVQDRWRIRRGVVIRSPRRFWRRTWAAEWDDAPKAYRAYTRNGAIIRGVLASRRQDRTP